MKKYPFVMSPCYKTMPWGGSALNSKYGKDSPHALTGESWEAADHKNGRTAVSNGAYAGMGLNSLAARFGADFLGALVPGTEFPVLFKLIDARENLSVQVHPDDAYAARDGDNGKTEMWIVLEVEKGAGLYLGFESPVSKSEYTRYITENSLEKALHFEPAVPGGVYFLPAGLVHAIGGGILVAEIQQSSDATYRVYDWGRTGADGKPRELHIGKALDVSDTSLRGGRSPSLTVTEECCTVEYLQACPLFAAQRLTVDGRHCAKTGGSFHIIFISGGSATVSAADGSALLQKGSTAVLPACAGSYEIEGDCRAYRFFIPDLEKDYAEPLRKADCPEAEIAALFARI